MIGRRRKNLITAKTWDDWLTPEGLHNTVVGTHDLSPKEIVDFCNYARREYYLRPAYMLMKMKNILKHPSELRRTIKAFFTFRKYLFNGKNKQNKEIFDKKIEGIKTSIDYSDDGSSSYSQNLGSLQKAEVKN